MTFSRLVEKIAICRCASEQSLRWNVLWYWFYLSSYHFAVYGLHEIHFSAAEFGLFNALFQQSAKRSVNVAVVCSANAFDSSGCKQFASLIQRDMVGYICLVSVLDCCNEKRDLLFWNIDLIAAAFVWTLVTVNYLPACHCALNRLLASNYLWCDAWCLLCTLLCWIHDWIHSALHSFVS